MTASETEVREGYRMTELGELPREWRVCALSDVYEFTRKPRTLGIGDNEELPFIPMELIRDDSNTVDGWEFRKSDDITSGSFVFKGDVIVAKITPSFENGKQAILHNLPKDYGYATTEIWALHPKDDAAIPQLLAHYLRLRDVRARLAGKMEGSTGRQRVPKPALQQLPLPLPPLPEQKKIDAVLQTVQQAKERTEAVILAARELKKSLLKYLFTYGPVPVDQAEEVEMQETEIGDLPADWSIGSLGEICDVRTSTLSLKELQQEGTIEGDGVLVHGIKVADMNLPGNEGSITKAQIQRRLDETRAKKRTVPPASVVFPKRGAAIATNKKRLTTTWTAMDPNLIAVTPGERVNSGYLMSWFLTFDLRTIEIPGPTPQLNKKDVEPVHVPIPSMGVQKAMAGPIAAVDQKIATEEDHKLALEELFNTLLNDLMTAKIRVDDLELGEVDHDEAGR